MASRRNRQRNGNGIVRSPAQPTRGKREIRWSEHAWTHLSAQRGDVMTSDRSYEGRCFCGAVQFTMTGQPAAMGYCHCESCRHWSAGPVNAFTLWQPDAMKMTRGSDNIGSYNKTANSV